MENETQNPPLGNQPDAPSAPERAESAPAREATNPADSPAAGTDVNAISSHKAVAVIGYIIPLLFFIPLVSEAKRNTSPYFMLISILTCYCFGLPLTLFLSSRILAGSHM
ncbi:MAG: hypothetical protein COT71_04580 [Candidatus Andersenbacteria bacterium CG10_big_fil_rev_8_21_14_0_10_54_11]|uniref:Uncharacterized protein n=1 Tax=Candidatus Andersenbacteria bacterium CG10_big_fil_rev_8_21_14_0_10_54_11 TaxID=1974485 RepID=A0A2M6WY40_9BACT|nr:MAG: hypothetical protein COT71_04580 [Candidatus Andersenbacteria bacterium CG10_big_fil_rev_8_21_14_0_10_54_11]